MRPGCSWWISRVVMRSVVSVVLIGWSLLRDGVASEA
jgi:hypothetical protein